MTLIGDSNDDGNNNHNHKTARVVAGASTATDPIDTAAFSDRRVVASFKTIPSRIEHIEPTLRSLLVDQTVRLDVLYLVLPTNNYRHQRWSSGAIRYTIPEFLTDLMETDPRLTILHPQYDYGPIDKIFYALERESSRPSTHLIYVDDDVIYHEDFVRTLLAGSMRYPDSVVGLSGCRLRSNFRQITHRYPREEHDKHPNLYYLLSGTESLQSDEVVDIVQGFTGVLVKPSFFDLAELLDLIRGVVTIHDIWKADDYIISAHLERRGVPRRLVPSGDVPLFTVHEEAATKENLGNKMHHQAMQAVVELRSRLGIWSDYEFVDYLALTRLQIDIVDCEAGIGEACERAGVRRKGAKYLLDTEGKRAKITVTTASGGGGATR